MDEHFHPAILRIPATTRRIPIGKFRFAKNAGGQPDLENDGFQVRIQSLGRIRFENEDFSNLFDLSLPTPISPR